ncbi:phosphoribosyl-ATP diphosphatase [Lichenihabitans sp. Uapishka_5]|uniref:phosphoribosyl-ATP diphosphatase n=1 Tax=Lichenihabitans sp. Uapishka_5 TaxID=3037302 RepID=UPI0029E81658|nr:phosphoribosyl-ATP diphosphatase [Lichenihabitans sp. Uapishka_5]MDX7950722.1 phosphoribosyl-ATP diphosphatase [Lichenihabitans sp. Uapishka_5]
MTAPARFTLDTLIALIETRALSAVDRSYTRQLLDAGPPRVAKKFGEEAIELVIATLGGKRPEIVAEAADVIYHLLVLLQASGVHLDHVVEELGRRTRQSGLDEKASRPA